ncbi:flexible cuticle protein 12-like [Bicyclus anynana]|uniref:Flexible cuticle protein 12-like n=1 Tax=Bicyclus anynana TaxID=110368 RepID=A0A6J1NPR4_BICAN|nr:flexible cuticle protein 12-like [Bicyclus anynana]
MKSFIVFALFVAAVAAAPQLTADGAAEIIELESDNIGVDGYAYKYKTSNGIQQDESGQLTDVGTENEGISVRGQYSYVGNDGLTYTVTYTAGKEGFVPSGAHIPQA